MSMSFNFIRNYVTFLLFLVLMLVVVNKRFWTSSTVELEPDGLQSINSIQTEQNKKEEDASRSVTIQPPTSRNDNIADKENLTTVAANRTTTQSPETTTTLNEVQVDEPDQPLTPHNLILWPAESACKKNLSFIVFVHMRTKDFDRRAELRRNYGKYSEKYNFELFFTLGLSKLPDENEKIRIESTFYKDIIQGNFIDAYRNITHKQLMHLRYAAVNCSTIPVILKFDDDLAWNMKKFSEIAKKIASNPEVSQDIYSFGPKMWCLVWYGMPVMREKNNPWAVPRFRMKEDTYCDYCSGIAYFYTNVTAQRLVKAAEKARFFWIDDVFITGHLVHASNVSLINIHMEFEMDKSSSKKFNAQNVTFSLTQRENTDLWFNLGNKFS